MKKAVILSIAFIILASNIVFATQQDLRFKLLKASGVVNREEIGGSNLYVVSLWALRKDSSVSQGGSFSTTIANLRPQKLSVIDRDGQTRALAIAFPQQQEKIVFDAKSTALAVLFQDSSSFGRAHEVDNFFKAAQTKPSFQKLTAFFRENLPKASLEQLFRSRQYISLLESCNREILGEDQKIINNSLNNAKRELEKVL